MKSRDGFGLVGGLALLAGCAGSSPSASAPPPASSASAAPIETAALPPPPSASAAPSASAVEPPPPPPAAVHEPVTPICQAKCDRLISKCSKTSVENCRLNCTKYNPPPTDCYDQVRTALECARDARDLTCANVAPESCSKKYRDFAACSSGVAVEKTEEAPAGLPAGWERVTDTANGFSVAMPQGSVQKATGDEAVRAVTAADGTTYTASVLPALKEKASEKSLLHLLMKIQGRCSDKVKLDGFVEKAGRSSIHFTAHCPDKTDWDGMIYIGAKNMVMLSAQAPAGKVGITEPFFYEFEYAAP